MTTARCQICGEPLTAAACARCAGEVRRPDLALRPPANSLAGSFQDGMHSFLDGVRIGLGQRTLRPWVFAPVAIAIVLWLGIGWACLELLCPLPARWLGEPWPGVLRCVQAGLRLMLGLLMYPLIVVIASISSYLVTSVLTSPICDRLSALTEELILGKAPARPRSPWRILCEDVLGPLRQSIALALLQLTVTIALFVVSLLSAGLATPLVFLAAVYFSALVVNDFPLARKRYSLRAKIACQNAHMAHYLGLGLLANALPFLLPFAAIAATRSYLALRPK
ncbi:MAG: EI24 domain-containing protein [Planctomycetota bacterium]